MIEGTNNLGSISRVTPAPSRSSSTGPASGSSFADILKKSVDEVSRLQQEATQAVNDLATGQNENLTGVMTAVEKSDLAFKTLLAIRAKLMGAYDEIKQISV